MNEETLYTVQVKLSQPAAANKSTLQFVNVTEQELKSKWRYSYRDGVLYQCGPGTTELISPFIIKTIFFIKQTERVQ